MLDEVQNLSLGDRERLFGYLEGTGKMILVEPGALLTEASQMPGLDGQKMSKSYNNTITLRESEESVAQEDPQHADRSGPRAPHRSGRPGQVPGLATAPGLFRRCRTRNGCSRAAAAPASAASNASSR